MFIDFIKQIQITDSFWKTKLSHMLTQTLPYQWEVLNDRVPDVTKSGAIANFKMLAGEMEKGDFYGFVFQDSDVYKWLEAVGYSLMVQPDAELEKTADAVIALIQKTQWDDGYLNSHYSIKKPDKRWTNVRDDHELYCAGHMIEAAVAYYVATQKETFLQVAKKFADHIFAKFGAEEGKLHGYPGHQEIELALVKLYRVTNEENYLTLAKYFITERGKKPNFFIEEAQKRGDELPDYMITPSGEHYIYSQSHQTILDQEVAVGHAVRAMYFYIGAADVAALTHDEALQNAIRRLWENVTTRQMYITGGIGSQSQGEAFSFDYDLPNDETYSETCAQIGLFLFSHRMFQMDKQSKYADVMERTLYNGIISGVSLDGKKYFYTNLLDSVPEIAEKRYDKRHASERQGWFSCACCPPNLARLLLSLGSYVYDVFDDNIYVNLYMGSKANLEVQQTAITIQQSSQFERNGKVSFTIKTESPVNFTLKLRKPYWSSELDICCEKPMEINSKTEDGYIAVSGTWDGTTTIEVAMKMSVKLIQSNPRVKENAGKLAIMRGPFVYCLEETDNGKNLAALSVDPNSPIQEAYKEDLLGGVTVITCQGTRQPAFENDLLYADYSGEKQSVVLQAIPYYAWNNRGKGEMTVWVSAAQ